MNPDHPDLTQPHGAPDQKARVLEWLQSEPGGLTQLDALQHLAVARLAAVIYRLRVDDGHTITTELVEMPTRYGPAQVARYHLTPKVHTGGPIGAGPELPRFGEAGPEPTRVPAASLKPRYTPTRAPVYCCAVCCDLGLTQRMKADWSGLESVPCPAQDCAAGLREREARRTPPDFDRLRAEAGL